MLVAGSRNGRPTGFVRGGECPEPQYDRFIFLTVILPWENPLPTSLNVAAGRQLSVNGAGTIEAGASATEVSTNVGTIDVLRGTLLLHNAFVNQSGASLTAVGTDLITFQSGLQNSGTVNLTDASLAGGLDGTGALTVGAGAAADAAYVTQQSLHVTGGGVVRMRNSLGAPVVSVVKSLQLDAGGSVDIGNNALVIDYTAGASPLASIRSAIVAGALTSSALTSSKAIGYAEATDVLPFANGATSDTFLGSTVDKTTILTRYTLAGDANLDGTVDFNDLVKLAQNYNISDGSRTLIGGDFTYDGDTEFHGLVKLAPEYHSALPGEAIPGAGAAFESDLATAFASVPEPSVLGGLSCLAGPL